MIAAIRSGIGSLVGHWFRGPRVRTGARATNDRQGSRALPVAEVFDDVSGAASAPADVAMRRFTAHALDSSLGDLRDDATPSELAELASVTRVLGELELQAKYLPRRPSILP